MFRAFWNDQAGGYAIGTAMVGMVLMAAVAGVVDFVQLTEKRSQVQNALDAAGIAIAKEFRSGKSPGQLHKLGREVFQSNHRLGPNPTFAYTGSIDQWGFIEVEVSSRLDHNRFIGWDVWNASARSMVTLSPQEPGCLLALHGTASPAIHMGGSTALRLDNCVMASNSTASNGISRSGAASLSAKCVTSAGGTSGLGSRTTLDCGAPSHNKPATPDPLQRVNPPSYTGCIGLPAGDPKTLTPGTYCGQTWSGNITLQPGNYILRGGQIDLSNSGSLSGSDVTIFLRDGATMTLNGAQTLRLKAPASGDYQGIALYQERGNTGALTLTGGSGTSIVGFVYAPSAKVFFRGNSTMTGKGECIRIVASILDLSGNSALSLDCESELGGRQIKAGDQHPRIAR